MLVGIGMLVGHTEGWADGRVGFLCVIELKKPRFSFYVVWIKLIPYSRFARTAQTDLKDFRHASSPIISIPDMLRVREIIFPKISLAPSDYFEKIGGSKIQNQE